MNPSASSACRGWGRSRPRRPRWCCGRRSSAAAAARGRSPRPCAAPRRSGRADRHDHEFLEVDRVVGVLAAVDDVHHRHRQDARPGCRRHSGRAAGRCASRPPWRPPAMTPRMALAPSLPLLGVPSSSIRARSMLDLLQRIEARQAIHDLAVDVGDGLRHALAAIALLVAVAQLDRLVDARAGARRDGRPAQGAVCRGSTSTSTVGLPRLSRISRARTSAIALIGSSFLARPV